MVRTILIAWLLLLTQSIWAQHYTNYSVGDGLPSPEVHYVHQDHKGFLWFCTDRGVSRYNGYEFENFTTNDGLTYNTVFKVFEDDNHDLLFTCHDGSISLFRNQTQQFEPFWGNELIRPHMGSDWIFAIAFKGDDIILPIGKRRINHTYLKLNRKDSNLAFKNFDPTQRQLDFDNLSLICTEHQALGVSMYIAIFYDAQPTEISDDTAMEEDILHMADFGSERMTCYKTGYQKTVDGKPVAGDFDNIYTCCIKDRENNYWLTTENIGVLKIPSFDFRHFPAEDHLQTGDKFISINQLGEYIVCGSNKGALLSFNSSGTVKSLCRNRVSIKFINRVEDYLWTTEQLLVTLDNDKSGNLKINKTKWIPRAFVKKLGNGNYISFGLPGVLDIRKSPQDTTTEHRFSKLSVIALEETEHGDIYFSTFNELYRLRNDYYHQLDAIGSSYGLQGKTVRKIVSNDSLLIFATSGEGVVMAQGKDVITIKEVDGLTSNLVNDVLFVEENSTLFCGTNKGISKITLKSTKDGYAPDEIININQSQGLPSNFVLHVIEHNGLIWAVTDNGVVSFDSNLEIEPTPPPLVHVGDIGLNGKLYPNGSTFKHTDNTVSFEYIGLSCKHPINGAFYRYRLLSNNIPGDWVYTNNRSVLFTNLGPAAYSFELSARAANSLWSQAQNIAFSITPFWLYRPVVWISLIALGLILVFQLYRSRITKLRKQQEKEMTLVKLNTRVNQLELAALRGQMNPHFIYNALQSIQKFILTGDKWEANRLVTRFGKLIRASLAHSRSNFISLTEEIHFLENYFQIEVQRFPKRFAYTISNRLEVEEGSVEIPPLLIQPICENAIKHSYDGSTVDISVTFKVRSSHSILVEIQDNGIGYLKRQTQTNKPEKAESLGLDIIRGRIDLLKDQGYDTSFTIESLDPDTNRGTLVKLILPIR